MSITRQQQSVDIISQQIHGTIRDALSYVSGDPYHYVRRGIINSLERVLYLAMILDPSEAIDDLKQGMDAIETVLAIFQQIDDSPHSPPNPSSHNSNISSLPPFLAVPTLATVTSSAPGRPSIGLNEEWLRWAVAEGYSIQDTANLAGVSISTVKRRAREWSISFDTYASTHAALSSGELDGMVAFWNKRFPHNGYRFIKQVLEQQQGVVVSFRKVQESMRRVDPLGATIRRARKIKRRAYNVRGPMHLWHMDTNHKVLSLFVTISQDHTNTT